MTCLECRDLMLEVARHRAAPFVDRSVLAHTAGCDACRSRLVRERALTAALEQVVREAGAATASTEVERRLMAAFAAQAGPAQGTPHSLRRGVSRWLPVAAALLLAAATATWWATRPGRVGSPASPVATVSPVAIPASPRPAPQQALVEPAGHATASPADPGQSHVARRPGRTVPSPRPPVEAVGFVPIPSAAGLPAFESGEIVRLGIPVTELPNYGLEIPAGGQASVAADLLIGQDGQARAIRLVAATVDAPRPRQ